jgi:hypothetical protein
LIVKSLPKYARFECADGDTTFSLHQSDEYNSQVTSIYFESVHLDQTVKELQEHGVVFESLPMDQTWLRGEAHLKDLDNNQLILYYAATNRKNPPWRIN